MKRWGGAIDGRRDAPGRKSDRMTGRDGATMKRKTSGLNTFNLKLRVLIVAVPCSVLALTALCSFYFGQRAVGLQIDDMAQAQVQAAADWLDRMIARMEEQPRILEDRQRAYGREPKPILTHYLAERLRGNEYIHGMYIF